MITDFILYSDSFAALRMTKSCFIKQRFIKNFDIWTNNIKQAYGSKLLVNRRLSLKNNTFGIKTHEKPLTNI